MSHTTSLRNNMWMKDMANDFWNSGASMDLLTSSLWSCGSWVESSSANRPLKTKSSSALPWIPSYRWTLKPIITYNFFQFIFASEDCVKESLWSIKQWIAEQCNVSRPQRSIKDLRILIGSLLIVLLVNVMNQPTVFFIFYFFSLFIILCTILRTTKSSCICNDWSRALNHWVIGRHDYSESSQ